MGQVQYSYTAKKKLKYKYTCEHCGKEVIGEYEVTGVSAKSSVANQALQDSAQRNLEASIEELKKRMENKDYPFKGLCPHCKKHQSWEVKNSLKNLILFPFIGVIVGFFSAWILADTKLWFLPLIILPIIGFIGALIYAIYLKAQTKKITNKQVPILLDVTAILASNIEELIKQMKENKDKED